MEYLLPLIVMCTSIPLCIHAFYIHKLKKEIRKNSENQVLINQYIRTEINKVKIEIELVHELIRKNEIEINESTKSKFDSLTNQIMKSTEKVRGEIPPTNDELMKEINQLKEINLIRMNM